MSRGDGFVYRRDESRYWYVCYFRRGKKKREPAQFLTGKLKGQRIEATDENREAAEKFLKHRVNAVTTERYGGPAFIGPEQQRLTVNQLLDALKLHYELGGDEGKPHSIATSQFLAHLKHIREHFGDWRAIDVTSEAIDAFIKKQQAAEFKPATINRSTQLLGHAFRHAIKSKRLSSSPHIRHLSEKNNVRQGFFGELEFTRVVENLPVYLQDFVRFGYLTGWRKGEIASLRWEDVDADVIRLRAENSKNGSARSVAISGELEKVVERRRGARRVETKNGVVLAELVFHRNGNPIVDLRKAWATATKLAGCPGRLFHDLRRTAVRNMVRASVPEKVAMDISGHKTRSIFDRYNIVSEKDKAEAMQKVQSYRVTAAEQERKHQPQEIRRVQ